MVDVLEQAIEAEAQAQAICMQTGISERAYKAFVARKNRCSRATDGRQELPLLAVFRRPAPRRWPKTLRRGPKGCTSIMLTLTRPAGRWSRRWASRLASADSGRSRTGRRWMCALCASRETLARHDGLADFALCHAGAWHGGLVAVRDRGTKSGMAAENPRRQGESRPLRSPSRNPVPMSPTSTMTATAMATAMF
jgi:hypothetical protein